MDELETIRKHVARLAHDNREREDELKAMRQQEARLRVIVTRLEDGNPLTPDDVSLLLKLWQSWGE